MHSRIQPRLVCLNKHVTAETVAKNLFHTLNHTVVSNYRLV